MPYYFCILFILIKSFHFHDETRLISIKGFAQGTTYQVKYLAADSIITQGEIDSILRIIDRSLSLYQEHSLISRFNKGAREIRMDNHLHKVIDLSLRTYEITGGAFDISVKPLVDLWGFGPKGFFGVPVDSSVVRILECVGSGYLQISGKMLIKKKPCIQIDCNGIAQGYSVDILAEFLLEKGIRSFLVEIGGEIRVKGTNEKSEHWAIGIERPEGESEGIFVPGMIRLFEGAITTSGSYRRSYSLDSKNYHHIIDPRTGYPANNNLISVTVIAKNAVTADAFDNAFMVMGVDSSLRFLKAREDIDAYFIYRKNDGKLGDTATKRFYSFIRD